jgi:cell division protein FtsI (penicillin-binding protein 3)
MVLRQLDVPIENKRINSEWVTTEKHNEAVAFNGRKIVAGLVPNVVSMGAKDAIFLLENAGLRVRLIGRGSVRSQSIGPGSPARKGDQIILEMSFI